MKLTESQNQETSRRHESYGGGVRIERRGRYWAVLQGQTLVCITVYLKGAREVVRRLEPEV
jgi:hypothetical protein